MDANDLKNISDAISGEAGSLTDKYLGEILTKQIEQKSTIQAFRDALSEMPKLLESNGEDEKSGENIGTKPLIFIIDELDRCRPLFALQILERIKHFFSVNNVHFVLGTHLGQLRNSVIAAYGANIDSHTYLQKFIHITFVLQDKAEYKHEFTVVKFIEYLKKTMDFNKEDKETVDDCLEFIRMIAQHNSLSLRSIERIVTTLAIALAYTSKNMFRPAPILAGLCALKICDPNLFANAKRGKLQFENVKSFFGFDNQPDDELQNELEWALRWWRFCSDKNAEPELIENMRSALFRFSFRDRLSIPKLCANDIVDRFVSR